MSETKRVWVNGLSGKTGLIVSRLADSEEGYLLVGGTSSDGDFRFDGQDIFETDFKNEKFNVVIVATTNLSDDQLGGWKKFADTNRVLIAPNAAIGVNIFILQVQQFTRFMGEQYEVEIVEKHHSEKIDSPSGTAKRLAETIKKVHPRIDKIVFGRHGKRAYNELTIHSMRGGTAIGEHTVSFMGDNEEIIMTHRAQSRELFAEGALQLAGWILKQKKGFYALDDVFSL